MFSLASKWQIDMLRKQWSAFGYDALKGKAMSASVSSYTTARAELGCGQHGSPGRIRHSFPPGFVKRACGRGELATALRSPLLGMALFAVEYESFLATIEVLRKDSQKRAGRTPCYH